jgi:hypothetical protein
LARSTKLFWFQVAQTGIEAHKDGHDGSELHSTIYHRKLEGIIGVFTLATIAIDSMDPAQRF